MARFYVLLIAAATASVLTGCNRSNSGRPNPDVKATDAGGVTTGTPTKKPMRRVIEQPGTIEGFEEAPLVARIPGYVDMVYVDIGKPVDGPRYDAKGMLVKPGTMLAELAVPEMLRELDQKTALVAQARAEVDQTAASLDAADANVLTARALVREAEAARAKATANYDRWKSEYARVEDLVKNQVVDRQIRDETLNQYKAADANRQEIEAKVQSAQAMAKESVARVKKARADVDAARAHVQVALAEEGRFKALADYRHIRAPFDGVVTRRNVHPGHFLQPNASGGPGILFVVARTDKLRIIADIPEGDARYIKTGLTASIQIPALDAPPFDGKVARTSVTLDAKTRTLRVEIDHSDKSGKVRPGMFANLIFNIDLGARHVLPDSAIFTHGDQPCCWRVVAGKAVRTRLKLGVRDGKNVEVLKMQTGTNWVDVTGSEEVALTNLGAISDGKDVRAER